MATAGAPSLTASARPLAEEAVLARLAAMKSTISTKKHLAEERWEGKKDTREKLQIRKPVGRFTAGLTKEWA
jgi:hypothetical protein